MPELTTGMLAVMAVQFILTLIISTAIYDRRPSIVAIALGQAIFFILYVLWGAQFLVAAFGGG